MSHFCTEWEPWILSHIGIVLGHDLIYSHYEQKQQLCNINLCGTEKIHFELILEK